MKREPDGVLAYGNYGPHIALIDHRSVNKDKYQFQFEKVYSMLYQERYNSVFDPNKVLDQEGMKAIKAMHTPKFFWFSYTEPSDSQKEGGKFSIKGGVWAE